MTDFTEQLLYKEMKNFSKTVKNIIDIINKTKIKESQMLGVDISEILFNEKESALVIDDGRAILICANAEKSKEKIDILCELFSLMQYMEENHIIFVVKQDIDNFVTFQHNANDLKEDGIPGEFNLGNSNRLIKQGGRYIVENNNGLAKLNHNTDLSFLYDDCIRYFCSVILPTALMGEFISHNYMSANDYLANKSITIARNSMIISVFVACLSPVASVLISNKCGYSTINKSQFDSLVKTVSDTKISLNLDTVKQSVNDSEKTKPSIKKVKK